MEGIVRQIWRDNPSADIVFFYTLSKPMAQFYDRGEKPPTVTWHERLAAAYGIPSLNLGETLWQQVHDGKAKWEALLPDNVHPSDQGHAIYAQQIRAFLQEHRTDKAKWARKRLPAPVSKDPFESARMIDPSGIAAQGWTRDDPTIRFPHSISADAPGTELKFPFRGTVMGLYWLVAPDSGDIEWSIDGSAVKRASSWDRYALRLSRAHYTILDDALPDRDHVLTFRILPEKNAESKGTWIRIGALLVN